MNQTKRLSCYVIGSESLLIQCASIWLDKGHEIRGVISDEPAITRWALERGLPALDSKGDLAAKLAGDFDYLFSITNLSVLSNEVLARPRRAAINFHDGPLPYYAGLYTPLWALVNREPTHGISWHEMRAEVDEGDLLAQQAVEISPGETSLTLNTKCYAAGIDSFGPLVDALASGGATPIAQDLAKTRYFGKWERPAAAGALDFARPAAELEALVRALDFGRYENPVAAAKLVHGGHCLQVAQASAEEARDAAPPGTVLEISADALVVATGSGALRISELSTARGRRLALAQAVAQLGLHAGSRLDPLEPTLAARLTELNAVLCRSEAFWVRRLRDLEPLELPYLRAERTGTGTAELASLELEPPRAFLERFAASAGSGGDALVAGFAAYLARLCGRTRFDLGFSDTELRQRIAGLEALAAEWVPLRVSVDDEVAAETVLGDLRGSVETARKRVTFLHDAVSRFPALRARSDLSLGHTLSVVAEIRPSLDGGALPPGALFRFAARADGAAARLDWDRRALEPDAAAMIRSQLLAFLEAVSREPRRTLAASPVLAPEEQRRILEAWNATAQPFESELCMHELFEARVRRTPDARAATFEGQTLRYAELNARANQLASHLRGLGIGPDKLVGVFVERSLELLIAVLAVHKAGGAYVPLDPAYPRDRIAFMLEDASVSVVLTQERVAAELPASAARVVRIDADWEEIARQPDADLPRAALPANLAYVIYTSGSTGKPKGVMVEHRNVSNFFTGMDARVPHDPPGVWLAVTSLSFDISVLELYWTLTRGFEVVVYTDRERVGPGAAAQTTSARPIDFGLFLWGSDDSPGPGKYRLMLDSARFADRNGFSSISTPERHFHAFGGPYPNPSVTSAAIAAVTERVQIRAGSCVLPLHHPIRVAEEWAVVDNLSNGRVAISFAAGWQPNDFVIRKEGYADAKKQMFREIDTVRRLWRGEAVAFENPLGQSYEARTLPRPVQAELPSWVTTAGNAETYRMAGAAGANVLTHLLGQSVDEVGEKVKVYRQARADAGLDPKRGIVTLMLHTFVGEDDELVRELVRKPMKDYLASSVNLIQGFAWAFPAFKRPGGANARPEDIDLSSLTQEELDAILDYAFERYFETSGMFGTPETCLAMVERVKAIDVDEIACLIDYGAPTDQVLASLPALARVRERANRLPPAADAGGPADFSLAAQVDRHRVTHLQCTPSMAKMMAINTEMRGALARIPHLFVGGEAFSTSLARELRAFVPGQITNMYGPTETTIWSTTQPVADGAAPISIGTPIANTTIFILDKHLQPVPVGVAGELLIGGAGVVRGYHRRPELTAERFVPDPFGKTPGGRLYRTGDLARWNPDGTVDFLGRLDHQVKIRGYRIELGEIESELGRHPAIEQCVVVAREDSPGDPRLVAYYVAKGDAPPVEELREALRETLPEFMVPSAFVALPALPLTPNGKVDRKALPSPDAERARQRREIVVPAGALEETIASVWRDVLRLDTVGSDDNFFDLGGHSLLVVQVHRALRERLEQPLSLTDLYRFPTIGSLAEYLSSDDGGAGVVLESQARGQKRRDSLQQRRRRRGQDK